MKKEMTRKEFLQRLAILGLVAGTGGSLLEGCGGEQRETGQTGSSTASKPATSDPCGDVSGLSELDLKMRNETLKYVAQSQDPAQRCDNCKFYTPPEGGGACGGCTLIKGPINPAGHCTSWFVSDA